MTGRRDSTTIRGNALWPKLFAALALFCVLVGLGTWQVQRLAWKEGLIAEVNRRINGAPVPIAAIEKLFAQTGDVDYRPVSLTGRFLNDRESHFLATWKGEAGFFVYTPMALADGRYIMVNRGFVPYDRKDAATRAQGQLDDTQIVIGLARNPLATKPSSLVPDNNAVKNIFYWKDLGAMAARADIAGDGLLPFFIDAGAAANPGGLPIGGVTLIEFPNNHLQYALTWYGLAAALAGVFTAWLVKRRRTGGH